MSSTAVSMLGNVERTPFGSIPLSYAVNFFGSNVSVCAIPPAIQSTITVSAVGLIFGSASAAKSLGARADRAASVAAEADFKKSRRVVMGSSQSTSINQLKLRQHQ